MFEREIKFINDFNLNKVNRLGPYFTFEQLTTIDLHPAILQYISAEIDFLVFEDRQRLLKNSVFDYSGEKINYHFNQISEELKKTKRLSLEYVAKLIFHASSFTVNYLVRPKWTLIKFVFDESNHKTTNEIKQILNYVYYYKYINKILISYINTKKILSMNSSEFEEILNRADKFGVEVQLQSILTDALKSMAEFLNIGEIKKLRVPIAAVELFLEEKELVKHLRVLNDTFGNDENAKYSIADYLKILSRVVVVKEEELPEAKEGAEFEKHKIEENVLGEEIEERESEHEKDEEQENEKEEVFENEEQLSDETKEITVADFEKQLDDNELKEETILTVEEEIVIKQNQKLRIKVGEETKIEPIYEEELKKEHEQEEEQESEPELMLDDEDDLEKEILPEIEEKVKSDEPEDDYISVAIPSEHETAEPIIEDEEHEAEKNFDEILSKYVDINTDEESVENEIEIENAEHKAEFVLEDETEEDIYEDDEHDLNESDEEDSQIKTDRINPEQEPFIPMLNTREGGKPDLAEILEHKEMTKIIEVIFDYDIEDFSNTLDEISNCRNEDDAHHVINETLVKRHVNRNLKEAELFRSIISNFFSRE